MVDSRISPPTPAAARPQVFRSLGKIWARARTCLPCMVGVACLLRLGLIVLGHTYRFRTSDDNFSFGWEMGRIGRSLAQGHGFGNPFNEISGATAWEPPLYPFLIGGVFKLFGVYSAASALVLLALNSIASAFTAVPIFRIAKYSFGEKVAVWSAWSWILLPPVMYWCTRWVWETSLAAFLLAVLFWLTLEFEESDGLWAWGRYGALWGLAALTNTSLLSFLPVSVLWIWYRRSRRGQASLAGVALAGVVLLACVAPWLFRNYRTFGQFVFLRSNFGAELRLGNGPGADGTWMQYLHPSQNVFAMRRYRQLGELAYVAERKQQALEFIRADYWRFARLSGKRFIYYWGGLPRLAQNPTLAPFKNSLFLASSVLCFWGMGRALRKRKPGAWLFLWLIVAYPAVYYFVFPHPRYRHPIEPELGILMVYLISEAGEKDTPRTEESAAQGF